MDIEQKEKQCRLAKVNIVLSKILIILSVIVLLLLAIANIKDYMQGIQNKKENVNTKQEVIEKTEEIPNEQRAKVAYTNAKINAKIDQRNNIYKITVVIISIIYIIYINILLNKKIKKIQAGKTINKIKEKQKNIPKTYKKL